MAKWWDCPWQRVLLYTHIECKYNQEYHDITTDTSDDHTRELTTHSTDHNSDRTTTVTTSALFERRKARQQRLQLRVGLRQLRGGLRPLLNRTSVAWKLPAKRCSTSSRRIRAKKKKPSKPRTWTAMMRLMIWLNWCTNKNKVRIVQGLWRPPLSPKDYIHRNALAWRSAVCFTHLRVLDLGSNLWLALLLFTHFFASQSLWIFLIRSPFKS